MAIYLLSLWPLPVFFATVQGVMWLSGNSAMVGLPYWISDLDMLLFLVCFGAAAVWTYRPMHAEGGLDVGLKQSVAAQSLARLPMRALKSFVAAGFAYGSYLLVLVVTSATHHTQSLTPQMLSSLTLSIGYCALVLVPALGLMVTLHHTIVLRLRGSETSDINSMRANNPLYAFTDSTRRPWLVFIITGFFPTSLLVLFAYLASMDPSVDGTRFIAGQGLLLFVTSVFASTCLVWLVTRALKLVTQQLYDGLYQIRKGEFGNRICVLTDDDFGELAQGLNLALGMLAEREALKGSLAVAAEIQQGLLPAMPDDVPGYAFAAYAESCQAVAGDYYDVIRQPDGRCWLVLADVAGKGYPAALTVANLQAMLHALAATDVLFDEAAAYINQALCRTMTGGRFVTLFMAKLQPESHSLLWLNAGHVPALLQSEDGIRRLDAGTPPLGVVPELSFEVQRVELRQGDRLLMYSDGVTELSHPSGGEMFGEKRLTAWLQETRGMAPAEVPQALVQELHGFGGGEMEDDVTILFVEREES